MLDAASPAHQPHLIGLTPAQEGVLCAMARYHFLTAQQVCRLRYSVVR